MTNIANNLWRYKNNVCGKPDFICMANEFNIQIDMTLDDYYLQNYYNAFGVELNEIPKEVWIISEKNPRLNKNISKKQLLTYMNLLLHIEYEEGEIDIDFIKYIINKRK